MRRTAEVAVVGGGIIGMSIAYQLARHGVSEVVVFDKGSGPGGGSTGASSSISRCRYTLNEVVRLARDGQEAYSRWDEFTGLSDPRSGLVRTGVVWILGETVEEVTSWAAKLTGQGASAEVLEPDTLHDSYPMLSPCVAPFDLSGNIEHVCQPGEAFLHEPGGGYADPVGAVQDLVEAARRNGVGVEYRSAVVGVTVERGGVTGVELSNGDSLSAGLVINAAGPWCNLVNRLAGWDHQWTITPTRIQTVYRSWPEGIGALPVGADCSTGIYFRAEAGGQQALVGSIREEDEQEDVADPDVFKPVPDAEFSQRMLASLHHRVPGLDQRAQVSGIAGLYTINRQDVHPIVGPSGIDGFWVANGFSGHGFKLAPAIGSMVARAVTGVTLEFDTDVPLDLFSVNRDPIQVDVRHVLA